MEPKREQCAVLLSYHGTVAAPEEVPGFLLNIRHGRPSSPEVIEEVQRRLAHIGGSPMREISDRQAEELQQRLGIPVRAAARLWHPYVRDVLSTLVDAGVRKVVSIPLAPQSVHIYNAEVERAASALDVAVSSASSWGLQPSLINAFAEAITETYRRFPEEHRAQVAIVLTAHSLPMRVIQGGDPYERDFRSMASVLIEKLQAERVLSSTVKVAFQSQGMAGGAWLGPDLPETFQTLMDEGVRDLLIAPIGFLAEHVETKYDIDVEAAQMVGELGFRRMERMPPMDTRPTFIDALEAVARDLLP